MESPRNLRSCVSWRKTRAATAKALGIGWGPVGKSAGLFDQGKHDLLECVALDFDPVDGRIEAVAAQKLWQELGIILVCFRDCIGGVPARATTDADSSAATMEQVPGSIAGEHAAVTQNREPIAVERLIHLMGADQQRYA